MNKVKIGIIGSGNISHYHLHGYKILPNVEVAAICDINEERAKAVAKEFCIPKVYTDYNKMVKEENLDGISVCTWNSVHSPAAKAALNAGINVLCEKPLAMNAEEAKEMVKVAKANKRLLMVGFVRRFGENAKALKEMIDNGDLGEIYYVKTGCTRRIGNPGGWFSDKKRSGGGPLVDLGVHMIDLLRYLMGKPKTVSVLGSTFNKLGNRSNVKGVNFYKASDYSDYNDVEDAAIATIKFDNGVVGNIETSWTQHIKEDVLYLEVYGSRGGATMEPKFQVLGEKNNYMTDMTPLIDPALSDFQNNFDRETAHFVDCIANGTECLNPGEDGVELMKILDAIYKSAEINSEVIVN
ncbi:MAG TPA: Gfo/Idh/MocA family oxidoreductase [Clostridiaceae bacterium]